MKIRTKAEMYRRWYAGELGNTPRTWTTLAEFERSKFTGLVGIRSLVRGGPCLYYNDPKDLPKLIATWPCAYSLTEAMPDDHLLLHGEIQRTERGLVLTYGDQPSTKMRDAMKSPKTAIGLVASMILRARLWPASLEEIEALLDRFEDAVVEFGAYDRAVGVLPHRNTVVWEVRNY